MSAGTILRSVTEHLPHVWCAAHGWHDEATHEEEVSQDGCRD